jgi:hypothetical protein
MRSAMTAAIASAVLGCLLTAASVAADPPSTATAAQPTPAQATPKAARGTSNKDASTCIRDTGSRIPPPKGQCLPVHGNVYTHKDLETTGRTTAAGALQQLDPNVTIVHH